MYVKLPTSLTYCIYHYIRKCPYLLIKTIFLYTIYPVKVWINAAKVLNFRSHTPYVWNESVLSIIYRL